MEVSRFKRLRQLLRSHWLILTAVFAAILIAAPFVYRASRLWGLPDIGAPFDVEKYGTIEITDEENAFVEYNQANPTGYPGDSDDVYAVFEKGWSSATPEVRDWLEENRDAVNLMKAGSEKSKALMMQPKERGFGTWIDPRKHRSLSRLAQLKAAQLRGTEDFERSWEWHRAAFRHTRHLCMYGGSLDRNWGALFHALICERIIGWSTDPHINELLLRQALDDVIRDYRMTPPIATTLRMDYFETINAINQEDISEYSMVLDVSSPWKLYLMHEPEVSKRVIKLVFANWLSEIDLPRDQRSPRHPGELGLFERKDGGTLPGGVSPAEIEKFFERAPVADLFLGGEGGDTIIQERTYQSQLEVILAAQIFYRKNGRFPKSVAEFVDGYLNKWPIDPFSVDAMPMNYRFDAETGTAAVWSVGSDETNDGGIVEDIWLYNLSDLGVTISAPTSPKED